MKMSSSMKSDHYYAEMLNMMREQGRKDNPTTIQLGVMQSKDSVKVDDLILNAEDLYIADYLKAGYKRSLETPYLSAVDIAQSESTEQEDIIYTDGLKKGDLVAVQKLNNNMYLILAKVVQA